MKLSIPFSLLYVATLLIGSPLNWAQEFVQSEEVKTAVNDAAVNNASYLWQVMLGLLFVLITIFAIAWLVRRFGPSGLLQNAHIRHISSLSVGVRERVVLIEVGKQQLLLGVAPGRVSTLHVFNEPVIASNAAKDFSGFGQKVREIMQQKQVS